MIGVMMIDAMIDVRIGVMIDVRLRLPLGRSYAGLPCHSLDVRLGVFHYQAGVAAAYLKVVHFFQGSCSVSLLLKFDKPELFTLACTLVQKYFHCEEGPEWRKKRPKEFISEVVGKRLDVQVGGELGVDVRGGKLAQQNFVFQLDAVHGYRMLGRFGGLESYEPET